ncbi:MAG: potassium channel family protein [Wenzhouxiangellaceae bacterium]
MPATEFSQALQSAEHWLVVLFTLVIGVLSVVMHYEVLSRLNSWLPTSRIKPRARVLVAILIILAAHVAEIWLFAVGIIVSTLLPGLGAVNGAENMALLDAVYLSAATFTTVGYGDLSPTGPLRFMMGSEALTGFVLITWSASFTYLEMQRYWKNL